MARVYRVYDELHAHDVALKHWWTSSKLTDAVARKQSITQFAYEYRTLAQLHHPNIVRVLDYGCSERGPHFTMELLDGGDLRERAPLPWREACRVFFDVCSALALLHSRRLIHRDVSPRNIRCTRTGEAKLIDFGAMRPMGLCQQVVGTPAYAAPEVVQGLPLDGRVDLFSLGATLYFALTGQQPSAARDFAEILPLAPHKPTPPSRIVRDVPAALDRLVLSLLDPDPALRPRHAFEVMQRLAALANFPTQEASSVAAAYLTTPELMGRDAVMACVRERCAQTLAGRGGSILIEGRHGMGRSRVLDVSELWAKTQGAAVLRARAKPAVTAGDDSDAPFALARELVEQLFDAVPATLVRTLREDVPGLTALFESEPARETTAVLMQVRGPLRLRAHLQDSGVTPAHVRSVIAECLLRASRSTPLLVAVDDVHARDAETLGWLASLAHDAADKPLLVLMSQLDGDAVSGEDSAAPRSAQRMFRVLCSDALQIRLSALSREQTGALLCSVFGDVPNLALLGDRVHTAAAGNPGHALGLLRWLVERGRIQYETGTWTLPSQLEVADLPPCAADTLCSQLSELTPLARELASAQALALRVGFTRLDYRALAAGVSAQRIDDAIAELVRQRIIEAERGVYTVQNQYGCWARVLSESLNDAERRRRHEALAHYCLHAQQPTLHGAHHLLESGDHQAAFERVSELLERIGDRLDLALLGELQTTPKMTASILSRCLRHAETRGKSSQPRVQRLRRWLTLLSVVTCDEHYFEAAPAWRAYLERSSGLAFLRDETNTSPACGTKRLRGALELAQAEYLRLPEEERLYTPSEAIRELVTYVGCSLAISARRLDIALTDTLPGLLEPFVDLSAEVRAVWQLAVGAQQSLCKCQVEQARARWMDVYKRLDELPESSLQHRGFVRSAIAYAVGATEATVGMQSGLRWTHQLDRDPLQAVSALYLRGIVRLQLGDFKGAEYFRRKAEQLSVHNDAAPMFTSTILLELVVHATGGELLGIKQLADRIAPLADRCVGWEPYRALATAYFERARGDHDAARSAFESCLTLTASQPGQEGTTTYAWPLATAGLVETLIELGDYEGAAARARAGLARCRRGGILGLSHMVVRALALAESKRGQHLHAAELLDAIIETARARAVSGLQLGCVYEARAVVAIEANDNRALERYTRMAAREYRYGFGSSLGARCERLVETAAQSEPALSQVWAAWAARGKDRSVPLTTEVARAMDGAAQAEGRAQRALRLLCEHLGASSGHLLLADGQGLRAAASYCIEPLDPALLTLAYERLNADLRQREDVTRVRGDTNVRFAADARGIGSDRQGHAFEPRVLHCVRESKPCCAGIALLVQPSAPLDTARSSQYANVLCAYLIDAGETKGL